MTSSIIEMTATVLAMVISIVVMKVMNTAGDGCLVKKRSSPSWLVIIATKKMTTFRHKPSFN